MWPKAGPMGSRTPPTSDIAGGRDTGPGPELEDSGLPADPTDRARLHMDRHDAARDGAMRGWISSKATSEAPYPQRHRRSGAHYSRWALPDVPKCSENVENVQIMAATLPQRRTEARYGTSKGHFGALQRALQHAAAACRRSMCRHRCTCRQP